MVRHCCYPLASPLQAPRHVIRRVHPNRVLPPPRRHAAPQLPGVSRISKLQEMMPMMISHRKFKKKTNPLFQCRPAPTNHRNAFYNEKFNKNSAPKVCFFEIFPNSRDGKNLGQEIGKLGKVNSLFKKSMIFVQIFGGFSVVVIRLPNPLRPPIFNETSRFW